MRRRSAVTLTEVLVALFIMAIGLMALLTLFPLGALSMAQAIKDGRAAQAAASAAAIAEAQGIRYETNFYLTNGNAADLNNSYPALVNSYTNAREMNKPLVDPGNPKDLTIPANQYQGPSYPVYVDPIGMQGFTGAPVGNVIPRRYCSLATPSMNNNTVGLKLNGNITTWFTVLDDMNFKDNGTAVATSTIERLGLYSWAYMLKRPRARDMNVVNLTVVVYKGRGQQLTTTGTMNSNIDERPFPSRVVDAKTISVSGADTPARRGSWILDITRETNQLEMMRNGPVHANFYRVVAVTKRGNTWFLELQTPLRTTTCNNIVLMENVVEVLDKGDGWRQ